jgi:nitrogen fixation protein FixH
MSATMTARRSGWIPWVFVGAMLLVVAVNGVLVFAAVDTFTGVTVGKSYDKGRAYNHVLEEAARQDALGWQPQAALEGGALRLTVRDRAGQPVAAHRRDQLAGVAGARGELGGLGLDLAPGRHDRQPSSPTRSAIDSTIREGR